VALLLFGAGRGVSGLPQTEILPSGIHQKQPILSHFGPKTAPKRGKIMGFQLLIRQQGKNASY
jgi:hypothetical protein